MEIVEGISVAIQAGLMIIGGASLFLKYIAPRTKTLFDDKLYAYLEKALKFLSFAESTVGTVKVKVKK